MRYSDQVQSFGIGCGIALSWATQQELPADKGSVTPLACARAAPAGYAGPPSQLKPTLDQPENGSIIIGPLVWEVEMEAGDIIATVAVAMSTVALAMSLVNRKRDIDREKAFRVCSRVWEILNNEPGIRTVDALDEEDGKTEKRVEMLSRTAHQLKVAGAESLGAQLEIVLEHEWPIGSESAYSSRAEFNRLVAEFLE